MDTTVATIRQSWRLPPPAASDAGTVRRSARLRSWSGQRGARADGAADVVRMQIPMQSSHLKGPDRSPCR